MKAKGTLLKYRTVYKHMQEFLDIRYHVKDIALKAVSYTHLDVYKRQRTPFSVDTCRHDAACISGSFSTGKQSFQTDMLQGVFVSDNRCV